MVFIEGQMQEILCATGMFRYLGKSSRYIDVEFHSIICLDFIFVVTII